MRAQEEGGIFTCSGSNLVDSPRRQRAIRVILNAGRSRHIRSHITSTEYSSRAASAAGANLVGEGAREKEENKDNWARSGENEDSTSIEYRAVLHRNS